MLKFLRRLFYHKKFGDVKVQISCDTSEFKKQMAGLRAEIMLTKQSAPPTVIKCGKRSTLLVSYRGELSNEAVKRWKTYFISVRG